MGLRETKGFSSRKREVNPALSLHQAFAEKVAQKLVLIVSVVIVVVLLMLLLARVGASDVSKLRQLVESAGVYGPLVLIAIIIVGGVFLIPATPAIILAGALYGALLGGLYAYIGIMLAASMAFIVARYFRKEISGLLGRHADVLAQFKESYLGYAIFLTRAIPVFHFEIISYASGLTSVSYLRFISATGIGILVPVAFFSVTGKKLVAASGAWPIIAAVVLVLALFLVPMAIDHYNPWGWKQKLLEK